MTPKLAVTTLIMAEYWQDIGSLHTWYCHNTVIVLSLAIDIILTLCEQQNSISINFEYQYGK